MVAPVAAVTASLRAVLARLAVPLLAGWLGAACAAPPPPPVEPSAAPWVGAPEGSLRQDDFLRVFREHRQDVLRCLERGLADVSYIGGRLYVRFVIAPDGSVASARVTRSTLEHRGVEACIVHAAYDWRFPRPEGGWVRATFPFLLSSR